MTNEVLRMQMLAGVITESEYKAKLQENKKKKSLKESMIGGIVGIGAINQIPPREKTDYEMAYEHYLNSNSLNEDEMSEMEDEVEDEISMNEEEGKEGKMYFHVLQDSGYGEIGHQGVYDTEEEAQNRANSLSDMFSDSSFYVEASDSEDEPYSVTSSDYDPDNDFNEGKEVEEPNNY